jgi:predicted esterase YcpF (UPF0227 family)
MKRNKLLYLHGFNSSPQSYKAELIADFMKDKKCSDLLICPQIPTIPEEAKHYLEQLVEETLYHHQLSFVGSSLGGYYAIYLAEKYGGSAVLINPSVRPYETLKAYLGDNTFYFEDGSWEFEEKHIQQLKDLNVAEITRIERYLVLLQTGDETLDYKEAELKYNESRCIIEQGGDHSFVGLERHLAQIMEFSNIDI